MQQQWIIIWKNVMFKEFQKNNISISMWYLLHYPNSRLTAWKGLKSFRLCNHILEYLRDTYYRRTYWKLERTPESYHDISYTSSHGFSSWWKLKCAFAWLLLLYDEIAAQGWFNQTENKQKENKLNFMKKLHVLIIKQNTLLSCFSNNQWLTWLIGNMWWPSSEIDFTK